MTKPTVGILSMQRVINYGSFLQAYALKQLLKENGAGEVYFVDIIPGRILVENPLANKYRWERYIKKLAQLAKSGHLVSGLKTFYYNRRLDKSIKSSWPILGLDKEFSPPLDLLIIGSDEVFNCTQGVYWGYTTQLFGDISVDIAHKVCSYAGSFGYTDLEKLRIYNIDTEIAQNLNKLSSISVRDENSASIVKTLTDKTPFINIDPVLAYGYNDEIGSFKKRPIPESYLIVYSYQDRIKDISEINAIKNFAKKNELKIICIFCRTDWCDVAVIPTNPIEVLRWFKFADSIITDTFHGSIFSIITKSKFASLIRDSNKNKLHYLLKSLKLEDREASYTSLDNVLSSPPNYADTLYILNQQREWTNQYLKMVLQIP